MDTRATIRCYMTIWTIRYVFTLVGHKISVIQDEQLLR